MGQNSSTAGGYTVTKTVSGSDSGPTFPIYDANGNLIGFRENDGDVRPLYPEALPPYVGLVATNTFISESIHATNSFSYCRTPHFAKDDITSLQVVIPNWYVAAGGGVETAGSGTATWTLAIEYPAGTFTQATFNGSTNGTVTAGNNLICDPVSVAIPNGAKFWVRAWQSTAGKIMFFTYYYGDGTAEVTFGASLAACPDKTMGGSGTAVPATGGACITPIAIIATTTRKSVAIAGDSIVGAGRTDSADVTCRQGYLARAIGAKYAYGHFGVSGERMQNFVDPSNTRRTALINAYCTHVWTNYGINDVATGRTAVQILADTNTFIGLFPTKKVGITTLTPQTTSTDAWVTVANQTVTANEPVRLVVNSQRRNGVHTTAWKMFDAERVVESSYMSGLWNVISGTIAPATAALTPDGTHPSRTAHLALDGAFDVTKMVE